MVIAFSIKKGGCGKSTTVMNVADGIAKSGRSVLVVDLDSQHSLTDNVGLQTPENTVYDLLKGEATAEECIHNYSLGFDIIPASLDLANFDIETQSGNGHESLLKNALKSVQSNYDVVLLDCPPSLNLITVNALTYADKVYIPVLPQLMALRGVELTVDTVKKVQKHFNSSLVVGGVIITQYESNRKSVTHCIELLEKQFNDVMCKTKIRRAVAVAEAPFFNQSVIDYDKRSNGAKDYSALTAEMIQREGL